MAETWKQPASIGGSVGKENMICPRDGIFLSLKKQWNSDTCYNMKKLEDIFASWNKERQKGKDYDFTSEISSLSQ